MDVRTYIDCSALDIIGPAWDRLALKGRYFVPPFCQLRRHLEAEDARFLIAIAQIEDEISAIACFVFVRRKRTFEVATRRLFSLPVDIAMLYGSCIVGDPCEDTVRKLVAPLIKTGGFDIFQTGTIFSDSPIRRALAAQTSMLLWSERRKPAVWSLIELPETWDAYVGSVPERTRGHLLRDCRRFDKAEVELRLIEAEADVPAFLGEAEKVSRLTYLWPLGFGVSDSPAKRRQLEVLARDGNLRAYLLYRDGQVCAFGWGILAHRRFLFEEMGYDPALKRLSPGTSLMMRMIRDLIERTNCRIFDLKWGTADSYKSRFANFRSECDSLNLGARSRAAAVVVMLVDLTFNAAKQTAALLLEHPAFGQRYRAVLRRLGMGTY
jgi:CelD/BcsL family acetyltransferase involved in cellulose biosynthesis